ncbi:MAG: hypothetical protein KAT04_14625 [Methylococcales bacterium]|nr:hypothetical protein [Methylococcales bacterium]
MTKNTVTNTFLSFKLIDFDDIAKANFRSILDLAEIRLKAKWMLIDSDVAADFYLFKNQSRAQMDQHDLLKSLPGSRCIFCLQTETGGDNELLVSSDNIPSMRSLIELFNHLSDTYKPSQTDESLSSEEAKNKIPTKSSLQSKENETAADTNYYDPEKGFLKFLLSTEELNYCFDVKNTVEKGALYINLAEKTYYSKNNLEQLKPFFSDLESQFPHDKLSTAVFQKKVAQEQLKPRPLGHLIWCVTFSCSLGQVIKGYNEHDIVHLKRWPDINLPGCRELIKLAAYMQSNSVDLSTVQKQTKIPIEQIYNFYNACKAIGLIEHVQQVDVFEKKLDNDKRQLFAKISKRLKQ